MKKVLTFVISIFLLMGCSPSQSPINQEQSEQFLTDIFPIKEEILKQDSCELLNITENELESFQFEFGVIEDDYCNVLITAIYVNDYTKTTDSFDLEYEKTENQWSNIDMHPRGQYIEPTFTVTKDIVSKVINEYMDNHTDLGFNGTDDKNKYDEIIINDFVISNEEKENNFEFGSTNLKASITCKYDTSMLKEVAKYNINFKYENDGTWTCKELLPDGKATLNYSFDGTYKPYTSDDNDKVKGDIIVSGQLSRIGERTIKNNEIVDELNESFETKGNMTVKCTVFWLTLNSYRDVTCQYNLVDDGLWNFLSLEGSEGIANFNPKNEVIFFTSEVSSLMPSMGIKKI